MRMSSATIPASSSSLLSSASRERHRFRNKIAVDNNYPPLELPLKWRNPLPDHLIHNQPTAVVRESTPLQPHSVACDSAFTSSRDPDRKPDSLPSSTRTRLQIATKPVHETSFTRHSVDPYPLQCNPKVVGEPEEAVADIIIVKEERFVGHILPPHPQLPPAANQQPIFHASLERSLIEVSPTLIPPPDSLQRDSSAEGEEQVGVDNHALSSRLSVKRECLARYEPAQRPPRPREDRDEDTNHHQSTKMSEILHVQGDQFGNQIREKFWEVVCTDHHINDLINGSSKAGRIGKLDEAYGVMQKMVEWFEKLPEFGSAQSSKIASGEFCAQVWDSCKDVSIRNSPTAASLQGTTGLSDLWQSETNFYKAFGGSTSSESVCFNGQSASFNSSVCSTPKGICLEKLGNGSYLSMVYHPDGSNHIFLSDQAGKIWLAIVPDKGSGGTLDFNESSTFLDITDMVYYDTAFGVMGLAFHPNFTSNKHFFVSYNCDKTQMASCSGRCSCNSDVDCDPSKFGLNNGIQPCRHQSAISEFTVNGSSSTTPSEATSASPSEVRRIFTMGLPYIEYHGGQILFGPEDGYLYFMMRDGGNDGDPFNFAQNKKSLLGIIMRLDVNNIPSSSEINDLGLKENYSTPKDNSSADDSQLQDVCKADTWRSSFIIIISSCIGDVEKAKRMLDAMILGSCLKEIVAAREGLVWLFPTYNFELDAYSCLFDQIIEDGPATNIITYSVLLDGYVKVGQIDVATSEEMSPTFYTFDIFVSKHRKPRRDWKRLVQNLFRDSSTNKLVSMYPICKIFDPGGFLYVFYTCLLTADKPQRSRVHLTQGENDVEHLS